MRAIRHAPLSHQLWPTTSTSVQRRFSPLCRAEFRGILLDILGVHRGRRWSGSLFPLTPEYIAAGDVWITTGTDGQIAGFVAAGTPRCACSSIRRRHRPCAAPRSDEARQGHTGLEQAARRGPADDPLADPNATRFYERGADRRVALGRRCPAACSRGVTLTSGVTGSADPNINRRSGGSASSQIP